MELEGITSEIIGAAITVHGALGPGLLESVYEECLVYELHSRRMACQRQVRVPVTYRGRRLETELVMDLLVEEAVVVELKAVERLLAIHEAQLLSYLKLSGYKVGLLINFNVPVLKQGLKRMVN
ncbi:MAG: GxxExxY protein [Gammaproteobacteria bacterium]|nr:MAG: GxxExxY protein [Gammaproteobacteria bacterium]